MSVAATGRWSRAFVTVGIGFFLAAQAAVLVGSRRSVIVVLGLYGFVFHVVFGKAYALLPVYFERELAMPKVIAVHLPLASIGVLSLALEAAGIGPTAVGDIGALSWSLGCLLFAGTLGWTFRGNLTGRATGTGEPARHRQRIDRVANAFVPLVLAYLVVGAVLLVAARPSAGVLESGAIDAPTITHVFAVGSATLLVFAVGFRVLPRFLVATPRPTLVVGTLLAGALGPAVLVVDFLGDTIFQLGAAIQALALLGFAVTYLEMYRASDRNRVGFHAVALGALGGVLAVLLGVHVAFAGVDATILDSHYRLAVTGFLGLTIVGVSYVFYPPTVSLLPGDGDRLALGSVGLLGGGLGVEVGGILAEHALLESVGSSAVLVGATLYAAVVWSVFLARR